jgi:hypothetical protein
MKKEQRIEYIARDKLLSLLSDSEVARVSTAETAARLSDGDEYIDLEDLDRGIQKAQGATAPMGRIVPRKAVGDDTWTRIVTELEAMPRHRSRSPA